MKREVIKGIFDHRVMKLVKTYYDPRFLFMQEETRARLKEVMYLAEDLGIIDFEEYEIILGIISFMGSDIPMEDRTW